jgi:hypothetical protein
MITSFLMGGIGNQMFQIATAVAHATRYKDEAIFNFTQCHTPGQGNTSLNYKDNIYRNIKHSTSIKYDHIFEEAEPNIYKDIPYQPNTMLRGYFQNIRYFNNYKQLIQDLFYIDQKDIDHIKTQFSELSDFQNTTSVHVRRGDYLKLPDIFPLCTNEYYIAAMDKLKDQRFIFVSDDIEWVKQNFKGDNIFYSELGRDVLDLTLMTMCANNIIANSSFSWWGAFLNKNKNKQVLSPTYWI